MTNSSTDSDIDAETEIETGTNTIPNGDPFERKVQLPGGSTFAISLPKVWSSLPSSDQKDVDVR
ncbi:hypothetical protein OB955_14215 [Halobacteria archaeon AArc-m2/3/4]|uniref:Uncharacterized protein n=1 Tax=Natronoglomus mannanivorans TaxID=2979990 RepID=A0AAP2Z0P3_9EURY|nr:hypothetical protein [Halobacteria archaeon AArc-xg1-1]MCU4973890.1 hypothetical protein [Halobacteria archaeon AArc-m2/3/4]